MTVFFKKSISTILIISMMLFSLASCSHQTRGRQIADKDEMNRMYGQVFLKKMVEIKDRIAKNRLSDAQKKLLAISDENLSGPERATIRNLLGIISFNRKNYKDSIKYFTEAEKDAGDDVQLHAQVGLNLSSSLFKNNELESAYNSAEKVEFKYLTENEMRKYHELLAVLASKLGKIDEKIMANFRSLTTKSSIEEMENDPQYVSLKEDFLALDNGKQFSLLEKMDQENNQGPAVAKVALLYSNDILKKNEMEKIKLFSLWCEQRFLNNAAINDLFKSLYVRAGSLVNGGTINNTLIGVILPLSGDKKTLGERAQIGFDFALEGSKYQAKIIDSDGSAASSLNAIRDLNDQFNVSMIIGGLIPSTATKEYLEAKSRGILFISLSPILLPRNEKNQLLIEIPASIESQISFLFSEKVLTKFGTRPGIIYPQTEGGQAYANEFWRVKTLKNLDTTNVVSYDKNSIDFRDVVQNILGIRYERERAEEKELVDVISKLERNKNIKRLQSLPAQIEFDWIFAPGMPREMVQVLPNFNYYDAFNKTFIGIPSWRSELMTNEAYRYGNVNFMDENENLEESIFTSRYTEKFHKSPKIVETYSYDAMKLAIKILDENKEGVKSRSDIEGIIQRMSKLSGESGKWNLVDGVWLKELNLYKIKREGISEI